ncbi:MAG TPA: hypothetical protein ACQGQH_01630 [Xylella sp.]
MTVKRIGGTKRFGGRSKSPCLGRRRALGDSTMMLLLSEMPPRGSLHLSACAVMSGKGQAHLVFDL